MPSPIRNQDLSSSISSQTSNPSTPSSSTLSKTYKQAAQLYLTRRLAESLSVLSPLVTAPATLHGTENGDSLHTTTSLSEEFGYSATTVAPAVAPIATASSTLRIKIWSLYITLLNAIVELGGEEGRREVGVKEWKGIVALVRGGEVWERVVRDGYKGREGSVDAEVVYNL